VIGEVCVTLLKYLGAGNTDFVMAVFGPIGFIAEVLPGINNMIAPPVDWSNEPVYHY